MALSYATTIVFTAKIGNFVNNLSSIKILAHTLLLMITGAFDYILQRKFLFSIIWSPAEWVKGELVSRFNIPLKCLY
jgi:hypothetical protein